jgi:hypothetical protein
MLGLFARLLGRFSRLVFIAGFAALLRPWLTPRPVRQDLLLTGRDRPADAPPEEVEQSFVPRPGWSRPKPDKSPEPTYWPAVAALGVMFFAWGIIANFWVLFFGAILFIIAIAGWIGDLLHESAEG